MITFDFDIVFIIQLKSKMKGRLENFEIEHTIYKVLTATETATYTPP